MARPTKTGLDYFPLDVHLDDKVELLEAEHGLEGFAIIIKLYQKIYANGYFIEWNEDTCMLFSRGVNATITLVNDVVNTGLRRGLFDKKLYEKYGILTSKGIQDRFLTVCKGARRKNVAFVNEYLLVVNAELIEVIATLTSENPEFSTQSKGKKTKEEEKKECIVESISYLNEKANKNYRSTTKKTQDLIKARFNEGFSLSDFKKVIDIKTNSWLNDKEMNIYLRPETLFGTKFEGYLNEKTEENESEWI